MPRDKHREVRQAVEHSLDYYLMSSMEERKPLREMIATAGFWMHLWIVAAIVSSCSGDGRFRVCRGRSWRDISLFRKPAGALFYRKNPKHGCGISCDCAGQ